jgi:hypothetical protein
MIFVRVLFLACLSGLGGCAMSQSTASGPVLARDILSQAPEPTLAPDTVTERFTSQDAFAHAKVEVRNLSGEHTVRWRWLTPTGQVYVESPAQPFGQADKSYAQATMLHKIRIAGEPAAGLPGLWTVEMYLDDRLTATTPFTLERLAGDQRPPTIVLL